MATVAEYYVKIRQGLYDRPTPVLYITYPAGSTDKISRILSPSQIKITDATAATTHSTFDLTTLTNTTMLWDALVSDVRGYSVARSFLFDPSDLTTTLMPFIPKQLGKIVGIPRNSLFPDAVIKGIMMDYFLRYLKVDCSCLTNDKFEALVTSISCPGDRHFILFVQFYLLEWLRVGDFATKNQDLYFTNDPDAFCGFSESISPQKGSVSVNVGDVFSMTTENGPTDLEQYNQAGIVNLFGDETSFWFRLQLFIREQFERLFGDYSLRENQVVVGRLELSHDFDYNTWYESYPLINTTFRRRFLSSC